MELATVLPLIVDHGMRQLAHAAAEDLLERIMRRDERASTPLPQRGEVVGYDAAIAYPRRAKRRWRSHIPAFRRKAPRSCPADLLPVGGTGRALPAVRPVARA